MGQSLLDSAQKGRGCQAAELSKAGNQMCLVVVARPGGDFGPVGPLTAASQAYRQIEPLDPEELARPNTDTHTKQAAQIPCADGIAQAQRAERRPCLAGNTTPAVLGYLFQ